MALPEYLARNLKIIFVGYNPGERSEEVQHHFAGRGNQFWRLLYDSGLTDRLFPAEEDSLLLQEGYGLTNIVARPSKSSADLTREELRQGAAELREKIRRYQPQIVCFQGKEIYRYYAGIGTGTPVDYGPIKSPGPIAGVAEYLAPNPSGRSTIPYVDKLAVFQQLRTLLEIMTTEFKG